MQRKQNDAKTLLMQNWGEENVVDVKRRVFQGDKETHALM